jgi:P4 family phage/plasmid primase-like protien
MSGPISAQPAETLSEGETSAALELARCLTRVGVPVFVAAPDASSSTGFALPGRWQHTEADAGVVDSWRPGMALCAVMGQGLDVLDVDPRNGGGSSLAAMNGTTPRAYGLVDTPSGGGHLWINSLGVAKATNVLPGIDVQAGAPDGRGRGFVFLPPTAKASKVDQVVRAYRWAGPLELDAWLSDRGSDTSGTALIAMMANGVGIARAPENVPAGWLAMQDNRAPQAQGAAEHAIAEKLAAITNLVVGQGGGRAAVRDAAFLLGGYVGGGYLSEDDAAERVRAACATVWGTPDEDDELWLAQGLTDGARRPFYVYTPAMEAAWLASGGVETEDQGDPSPLDSPVLVPPWTIYSAIGAHPFEPRGSDQEQARAVLERMMPALRWSESSATWLSRGRERWFERHDRAGWAVSLVAWLMPPGLKPRPKDQDTWEQGHWQSWARDQYMAAGGSSKITRKVKDITRDDHAPWSVDIAELDADPEVLWAGGWPWSLTHSAEAPTVATWVDPATPHLHTASVIPAPGPTPVWDEFLAAVWPDPEIRAWALRVLGITLTGHPDAALPVLYGRERSGKSSVIGLLNSVLGTYGIAADARLLTSADNAHASIIYALKGARLAFVDEGPRTGRLATERLKQLTGGIPLTGNPMRGNPITFDPTHTLVLTSNDEPPITDPALAARMRMIPCDSLEHLIRPLRQRLAQPAIWAAEAPGILAAMMAEAARWLGDRDSASNHRAPAQLQREAAEMAVRQSPVAAWIDERCVRSEPGTPGRQLYAAYAAWLRSSDIYGKANLLSETAWGRALNDLGHPHVQVAGRWYRPLSVIGGAPDGPLGGGGSAGRFGGFVAGSPAQPANPQTASSEGVFSNGIGRLAGSHSPITSPTTHSPITTANGVPPTDTQEKTGKTRQTCAQPDPISSADLGGQALAGCSAEPAKPATPSLAHAGTPAPAREDPSPRVTARTDTGRVSVDKRRVAAEAKAAARLDAIAVAECGEVVLPAAVNRAGVITECTPDEALIAGRCIIARAHSLTIDVENTGYWLGRNEYALTLSQLGDDELALVFDPTSPEQRGVITSLVAEAPALHAHSATADLNPLAHAGMTDIDSGWYRMWDTVIPAKLGDPKSTGSDPDLKKLSANVLGAAGVSKGADEAREALFKAGGWKTNTKPDDPPERSGWAQVKPNSATFVRYAAADVLDTAALVKRLPVIPDHLMHRERVAQEMTARVSYRGLPLDGEHIRAKQAEHTGKRAAALAEIGPFGVENPKSAAQVAAALARVGYVVPRTDPSGKFPEGQPSCADHVLQVIKKYHPDTDAGQLAAHVIDWRSSDTALNLFLKPYALLVESGDGRARPTIYTLSADTGRMSSVRPNCQQLPREGGLRAMYRADPGMVLIKADFSGVELRGAAGLSQDPVMLQRIIEEDANTDPKAKVGFHWMVAHQAFGPDASKGDRYTSKRGVFGTYYGGGVKTLAQEVGVAEIEMSAIVSSLKALTPTYFDWARNLIRNVRNGQTGLEAYSGRIIHFPPSHPHKATAYSISGSCRELLVDALMRWRDTRWGNATLMPVHDELIIQVPAEDGAEATAALTACMENTFYGVRIKAEPDDPSPFWTDSV